MKEILINQKELGWNYCKKCKLRVPFVYKKTGYCQRCTILFEDEERKMNTKK
jgi:hypothetical protein